MCRPSEDNSNISLSSHDRHLHVNIVTQPTAARGQAASQPTPESFVSRLENTVFAIVAANGAQATENYSHQFTTASQALTRDWKWRENPKVHQICGDFQ